MLAVVLGTGLLLTGAGLGPAAAGEEKKPSYETREPMDSGDGSLPTLTILPREVSKSLKITRVPTSEPTPLLIGTYWNCFENDQGFEFCRIKLVVCTDDQSFCTEVP